MTQITAKFMLSNVCFLNLIRKHAAFYNPNFGGRSTLILKPLISRSAESFFKEIIPT